MSPDDSNHRCAICDEPFSWIYQMAGSNYDHLVCQECDAKAVTTDGKEPKHGNEYVGREKVVEKEDKKITIHEDPDIGDNPVFINGKKCWRNYKFGGWITLRDPFDCDSINEFNSRLI